MLEDRALKWSTREFGCRGDRILNLEPIATDTREYWPRPEEMTNGNCQNAVEWQ